MTNTWGDSEPSNFTVGYPPAVVTGVSPSTWVAGSDYDVTVTGTGFGSAPSVSAIAAGVSAGSAYNSSPDGTQTHFHVHVDINSPNEGVQIVVSPGYAGSNFTCGNCNGGSPDGSAAVVVQAVTPSPHILMDGQDVTGTTQQVSAGQRIALSVSTPSGYTITSQQWSIGNQQDITGGFITSSASGYEASDPASNTGSLTFYWVVPGVDMESVNYTYQLSNGQSASAGVTFNVDGPTGNLLLNTFLNTTDAATSIKPSNDPTLSDYTLIGMRRATVAPFYGVFFNAANATAPKTNAGVYTYTQILHSVVIEAITAAGSKPRTQANEQLDGGYPYPIDPGGTTHDAPAVYAPNANGESGENFDATMYLLWDPALPSGCVPAHVDTTISDTKKYYTYIPSTCTSTPIPLSSARWGWSNCAINQGVDGSPNWQLKCGPGRKQDSVTSGYPTWNSCSPSKYATCQ